MHQKIEFITVFVSVMISLSFIALESYKLFSFLLLF